MVKDINFDEGRVIMDGTNVYFTETHLRDHLGNTRVVFGRQNNALVVKQVNSYYPFGMNIKGLSTYNPKVEAKHPANEYLYNGKMLQDELGLDWLDYGARMYDAVLGRFTTVDPLAEMFSSKSPYCYVSNNPISRIDPSGMADTDIYGRARFDENGIYITPNDRKPAEQNFSGTQNDKKEKGAKDPEDGDQNDKKKKKNDKGNDELPSTFDYKNGDKVTVNGQKYQLHNCSWVKLSGEMVDAAAFTGRNSGGVYMFNPDNMIDRAIIEADMALNAKDAFKGLAKGIAVESFWKWKITVPAPGLFGVIALFDLYEGIYSRVQANIDHDNQAKLLKTSK